MLRLYLRQADKIAYWETWEKEGQTCVHSGQVGQRGETLWFPAHLREALVNKLAGEVVKLRDKGYEELAPDEFCQLVAQFPAALLDAASRERVEALFDEALGWTGNGTCDGVDANVQRVNVLCAVILPALASETLVAILREERLLKGATLAATSPGAADFQVLWPTEQAGRALSID